MVCGSVRCLVEHQHEPQVVIFSFSVYLDSAAPKPVFAFMSGSSTTPASTLAPSLFGTTSSSTLAPTPAPTSTFVFGQNASTEAPPKTFMFGQQQETQPAPAEAPAAPNPAPTFVFGSVSTSNASPFAFGGAPSTSASTGQFCVSDTFVVSLF